MGIKYFYVILEQFLIQSVVQISHIPWCTSKNSFHSNSKTSYFQNENILPRKIIFYAKEEKNLSTCEIM